MPIDGSHIGTTICPWNLGIGSIAVSVIVQTQLSTRSCRSPIALSRVNTISDSDMYAVSLCVYASPCLRNGGEGPAEVVLQREDCRLRKRCTTFSAPRRQQEDLRSFVPRASVGASDGSIRWTKTPRIHFAPNTHGRKHVFPVSARATYAIHLMIVGPRCPPVCSPNEQWGGSCG